MESHLASLVDRASEIILTIDGAGRIVTWNAAAERLLGYSTATVRGCEFVEICATECQKATCEALARVDEQQAAQVHDCPVQTAQSTFVLVSWVFSPLLDRSNQRVGVVATGRELTERREIEAGLIWSQRLSTLGAMVGSIAHEIRNPMAICSSAAQFLMDEEDGTPAFRRGCVDKIQRAVQRTSAILENLLKYSRSFTPTEADAVNLVPLIQETLALVGHHAMLHKVQMKVSFSRDDVTVQGTATLLQQVFMHLFLNAIHSMAAGGSLEVDVRTAGGCVSIHVTDTGHGIPERDIDRVFDSFRTTSSASHGTGLSLFVCHSIVRQHAGTIEVRSVEGRGTTFTVRLPSRDARVEPIVLKPAVGP